ncbi:MAG: dihydrofolate reductase family protein, partial [Cyclobacteriaceae bacterium]|nr:dihydrofolate reductase family protein [Cyclobacteriaceae bacterium]
MNIDGLWKGLLALQQYLRKTDQLPEILYLSVEKNEVTVELPQSGQDKIIIISSLNRNSHFYVNDQYDLERGEKELSREAQHFLSLYLPICFYQMKAKKRKSAFTIAHFAQSLDAKIATENGASQWIGNEENLIHAHRMRALCDGVLIGAKTLKTDKPRLTVRHVEGPDPVRIVMGDGDYDFSSLAA